jgi:hypothetical protein
MLLSVLGSCQGRLGPMPGAVTAAHISGNQKWSATKVMPLGIRVSRHYTHVTHFISSQPLSISNEVYKALECFDSFCRYSTFFDILNVKTCILTGTYRLSKKLNLSHDQVQTKV